MTRAATTSPAGLGVGHIWTAVQCPAYQSLDGADCTCDNAATEPRPEVKIAPEVLRGVALLDANVPDWRDRIDLETLDLADCELCVLGQVFGAQYDDTGGSDRDTYSTPWRLGVIELGLGADCDNYGFDAGPVDYAELQEGWEAVLSGEVSK